VQPDDHFSDLVIVLILVMQSHLIVLVKTLFLLRVLEFFITGGRLLFLYPFTVLVGEPLNKISDKLILCC
jgi:hypothetical protein